MHKIGNIAIAILLSLLPAKWQENISIFFNWQKKLALLRDFINKLTISDIICQPCIPIYICSFIYTN